jgi:hypothetical protein
MPLLDARQRLSRAGLLLLVAAILLVCYGFTLAPGITWANYGVDSGDFATAAATLGIPHPPGYPTYTLLANLFQRLPLGEPAYATNWFSAFTTALAAGLFASLVFRIMEGSFSFRICLALISGLALGWSPLVWSQAVITEVHGLNLLFTVLALYLAHALADAKNAIRPGMLILALLIGLGLGNHLTLALLIPGLVVLGIRRAIQHPRDRRQLWVMGALLVLGSLVYLYLPLRSHMNPLLNWGNPTTWQRFWWTVSADPYQGLAFSLPGVQLPRRIAAWAALIRDAFGYLGLILGIVGLMYGRSKARAFDWLAIWLILVYSAFAIGYSTADSTTYLIPAQLGFLWLIILGLKQVVDVWEKTQPKFASYGPAVMLGLFAASTLLQATQTLPEVNASEDLRAENYAQDAMRDAPADAVILTWQALDSFPLWYYQLALGYRPDLAVIVIPLLQFDWYGEYLERLYPGLPIPDDALLRLDDPTAPSPPEFWNRPVCYAQIQTGEKPEMELICSADKKA